MGLRFRSAEIVLFGLILATLYIQWSIILAVGIAEDEAALIVIGIGGLVVNLLCTFLALRLWRFVRFTR